MSQSLVKNSIFNLAFKGFNVLYPMITSAYISRIFMADGVGQIMFVVNIVTYFSLAASLGLPNYAVKVISGCRDNREKLNRHFTEFSLILAISSIVISCAYYASVPFIYSEDHTLIPLALILGLMVLTNITNYDWLFESLEDFRFLAYRSITVKCVLLISLFILVKDRSDILIYCGIYASITVINNIWNFFSFKRYANHVKQGLSVGQHVKPISFLFAAAFATEIYTLLDCTMLGVMCNAEYLGYYSNASKVVRSFYGVIFAAIAVYNPRLSYLYGTKDYKSYKDSFQQYYNIAVVLSVPSTLFLFFAATPITVLMFGEPFLPAAYTLKILSLLIIVFSMATVFGHFALIIYGKEKLLLAGTIVGAIVNFSLNQMLITSHQQNGAAMASVVSEVIVTGLLMYFSLRCFKIQLICRNLVQVVSATFITGVVAYFISKIEVASNLFQIIIIAVAVFSIFGILLLFAKNQVIIMIINKIKR